MQRAAYAARRRTCFCNLVCNLVNLPWLLAAYNPAAIPPRISAVRVDGLGSHFMAPSTTDGGSLACGDERLTRGCRRIEAPAAKCLMIPRTKGTRSCGPRLVTRLPSSTKDSSSHVAPALTMSSRIPGQLVTTLPFRSPADASTHGP